MATKRSRMATKRSKMGQVQLFSIINTKWRTMFKNRLKQILESFLGCEK